MLQVYRDKNTGYGKGYFKRPVTGLGGMTLDCSQYISSDSTIVQEEEPWAIEN
jgi:hypothetical protein